MKNRGLVIKFNFFEITSMFRFHFKSRRCQYIGLRLA